MAEPERTTHVGDYLIHSPTAQGVAHIFGVPGDFELAFMSRMTAPRSPVALVNTCDEQRSGFAADA